MSTCIPHNSALSNPSNPGGRSTFRAFKTDPSSSPEWLAPLILSAKGFAAGAEILPFPYLKGVFGAVVFLLETVETVKKNRDSMKELCGDAVDIIAILQDHLETHGDTVAIKLKGQCEELEAFLQNVVHAVEHLRKRPTHLKARIKEVIKSTRTTDEISGFRDKIREVRSNFMLRINMDTNVQVQKVLTVLSPGPETRVAQVSQLINNCPPPTRIFHGRQPILQKMHQYFTQKLGVQNIFLLHGLGGAGKTQIGLKFVEESASRFTDIFLIDTSNTETIETGLKNISTTKSVGQSSQDALQWLRSKQDEWLLFFDNADDPRINLNNYFPKCNHGNILITSRNPGLRVYTQSYSHVSDMEETEAVDLLLRSAAQDMTNDNKETAILITLCYLPLAIIQAGAFIAKTGILDSYLPLYEHNQARLLSQKPTQSHDTYAWTVYTTWQISFEQLSPQAQKFLQLCSFLHYRGISEEIFKNASNYKLEASGPSAEQLQMAFEFLSHFMTSSGGWDSFYFIDVTTEITSYSLMSFEIEHKIFSMHPLVHDWTRSTLSQQNLHHDCMAAIVGMALAGQPEEYIRLASTWMLPHVDFLITSSSNSTPDFRIVFGQIYLHAGETEKSRALQETVLEKRRDLLGRDHLDTLTAMYWLAWAPSGDPAIYG
ncbi:P-loop containing nucleoside triphosphate hydrolase protein [Mycena epipterygia]|nr:P-loop containing nucleoside triphosphate hydrolase protein [Mycena epipterygia]